MLHEKCIFVFFRQSSDELFIRQGRYITPRPLPHHPFPQDHKIVKASPCLKFPMLVIPRCQIGVVEASHMDYWFCDCDYRCCVYCLGLHYIFKKRVDECGMMTITKFTISNMKMINSIDLNRVTLFWMGVYLNGGLSHDTMNKAGRVFLGWIVIVFRELKHLRCLTLIGTKWFRTNLSF